MMKKAIQSISEDILKYDSDKKINIITNMINKINNIYESDKHVKDIQINKINTISNYSDKLGAKNCLILTIVYTIFYDDGE